MKLTTYERLRAGRLIAYCLLAAAALAQRTPAQAPSTTTVTGTVYLANGQPGAGTLILSWPAFTTAAGQLIAADSLPVTIPSDGFVSVNLAANQGATPAGEYYTAVYYLSDGSTHTQYWTVPAAASATLAAVQAQVMPAAQAVQAVSKAYVDESIAELAGSELTASGGTLTGPLYLSGDPAQPLQAADKHYVDAQVSTALPLTGGTLTGPFTALQIGAAYQVDQFPGADIGAKIQACVNAVNATYGGTCDARNFTGSLSMASNLTISTANTTVLLPCATIATANQVIVTAGTRNVVLHGCALRGGSAASGSQGGTVFAYSGAGATIRVGDPAYAVDTPGVHLDNVAINTTAATSAAAQALAAYRTQELDLESLYLLGNSNQTGITLDGSGNYTGGTFLDDQLDGFGTAVNAIGHQISNPATTDWVNASTFVRLHIDCPTSSGSPISGTYGINLASGDGNTFTGGDVEGCATALHLGANAQNNTIVGLRNENSTNQVVADAGSSYNNWMAGGAMFTGKLTDNGTRNSFLDTFHRSFNGMNGDWYGSQQDATVTNHYRLGTGTGNERGLLDEYQTDYGYRWTTGLSDASGGEQFYQILDQLNNVYRFEAGQYNNGASSTNNQTVINAAGTGAVVLNGSNNAGTGGVVIGSGGSSESTVATVSNAGNAQFNGTLQVGGTAQSAGTMTVRNNADAEVDYYLWPGLTASQKGSFTYKDWNGNSQWYLLKDASNNWALNSALGGLDSFKAYQSSNSGDTYVDASNSTGHIRLNYESGSGAETDIYSGSSSSLVAAFLGPASIKLPGLAASSGENCLQIDNAGYVTNTGATCGSGGGGGSGTVNSGTTGQIAYYNATGTAVAGTSTVPVTAGGTGSSTATGALAGLGGLPLAGGTMTGALNGTSAGFSGPVAGSYFTDQSYPTISTQPFLASAGGDHCVAIADALNFAIGTLGTTSGRIVDSGAAGSTNCAVNPMAPLLKSTLGGYGAVVVPVMSGCSYPLGYPVSSCGGVSSVDILAGGANYSGTVTPTVDAGSNCSVAPVFGAATITGGAVTSVAVTTAGTCPGPPRINIPGAEVIEGYTFEIDLSPGATYIAQLPWATGYGTTLNGLAPWGYYGAPNTGATIVPATGFPPNTPLVSHGCAAGSLGACNTQGGVVQNLTLVGKAYAPVSGGTLPGPAVTTAGDIVTGATGLFNGYAQNGAEWSHVNAFSFDKTCFDLEQEASSGGGAQESGPYHDLFCSMISLNNASSTILRVGSATAFSGATRIYNVGGQCASNAVTPTYGVLLDKSYVSLDGVNIESCWQTVGINVTHGSAMYGVSVRNVNSNNAKYAGLSAVTIAGGSTGTATTNAELANIIAVPAPYNLYVPATVPGLFSAAHTSGENTLNYYLTAAGQVATSSAQGCSSLYGECSNYANSTHTATAAYVPADVNATDGGVESMAVGATTKPLGIIQQGRYNSLSAAHDTAVQSAGQGPCYFPNNSSTTQGDYVIPAPSGSTYPGCYDTGSQTPPTSGYTLGTVGTTYASAPSTPSTPGGLTSSPTGSANYAYSVYEIALADPTHSAVSASVTTSAGPSSLAGTSCNTVTGIASPPTGFASVIRRETGGVTQGAIGQTTGASFQDCGLQGDGSTAPSTAVLAPMVNMAITNFNASAGVAGLAGPTSTCTGTCAFNGNGVSQSGSTFTFSGAALGQGLVEQCFFAGSQSTASGGCGDGYTNMAGGSTSTSGASSTQPLMAVSTSAATAGDNAGWFGSAAFNLGRLPQVAFSLAYSASADYTSGTGSMIWLGLLGTACNAASIQSTALPACNMAMIRYQPGTDSAYMCVSGNGTSSHATAISGATPSTAFGIFKIAINGSSGTPSGVTCTVGSSSASESTYPPAGSTAAAMYFLDNAATTTAVHLKSSYVYGVDAAASY
jgi:hypothetical protein